MNSVWITPFFKVRIKSCRTGHFDWIRFYNSFDPDSVYIKGQNRIRQNPDPINPYPDSQISAHIYSLFWITVQDPARFWSDPVANQYFEIFFYIRCSGSGSGQSPTGSTTLSHISSLCMLLTLAGSSEHGALIWSKSVISICWRHLVTSKESSNPIFFGKGLFFIISARYVLSWILDYLEFIAYIFFS